MRLGRLWWSVRPLRPGSVVYRRGHLRLRAQLRWAQCGSNGCGGSCGSCARDAVCVLGGCLAIPARADDDRDDDRRDGEQNGKAKGKDKDKEKGKNKGRGGDH